MNVRVVNPSDNVHFFADQTAKFGFLAAPDLLGQFWFVDVGQEIVGHKLPSAQQVYVVLEGSGRVRSYASDAFGDEAFYVPNPVVKVDPPPQFQPRPESYRDEPIDARSVVAVPPGVLHTIYNDGSTRMVLVSLSGPQIQDAVYISR